MTALVVAFNLTVWRRVYHFVTKRYRLQPVSHPTRKDIPRIVDGLGGFTWQTRLIPPRRNTIKRARATQVGTSQVPVRGARADQPSAALGRLPSSRSST